MTWTLCRKELPPLGKEVLTWSKKFGHLVAFRHSYVLNDDGTHCWHVVGMKTGDGWHNECLEYEDEYPTHWQPLPREPRVK